MAGSNPVNGTGPALSRVQFEAQYQVQVLKKQQDTVKAVGEAAVELIQTALSSATQTGTNINTIA